MDCSYIEDESIHIIAPYSSEPRWALCHSESIDEGEHQVSRSFESKQIDDSELHHRFIPFWKIVPSKAIPQGSRPMTSIVSVPLKKHSLDESVCEDWEDVESKVNRVLIAYGRTGKVVFEEFRVDSNLEGKIIEEFLRCPEKIARVAEKCKDFISFERNPMNKILIDLTVQFWKDRDHDKLRQWVDIAKEFYLGAENIVFTNFAIDGILDFERKEEYLGYYQELLQN